MTRSCATDGCFGVLMAKNPGDHCWRCNERAKTAARNVRESAQQREWLNWSGPLRDGCPLWRDIEPGPLMASMGLRVGRDELRMAA